MPAVRARKKSAYFWGLHNCCAAGRESLKKMTFFVFGRRAKGAKTVICYCSCFQKCLESAWWQFVRFFLLFQGTCQKSNWDTDSKKQTGDAPQMKFDEFRWIGIWCVMAAGGDFLFQRAWFGKRFKITFNRCLGNEMQPTWKEREMKEKLDVIDSLIKFLKH